MSTRSVVIVGGGPAGAVAGAVLSRAGLEVTIVEQGRFPREKVCGECLSGLGARALGEAGMVACIEELRPVELRRARLFAASASRQSDRPALEVPLPAAMWGITRGAMDTALLEAARTAGARIIQPARVERLVHAAAGGRPAVDVRPLAAATQPVAVGVAGAGGGLRLIEPQLPERLEADLVLLADGKSLFPLGKPPPTGDLGIKAHFEDVDAAGDAVALFGLCGHYVGLAPVSDGRRILWNLAASVPAERVREVAGDFDGLLAVMRHENAALGRALAGARRVGEWHACALPRFAVRREWPEGVIPLGNAIAALEPVGGEGMGLAIASAVLAARCVLETRCTPADLARLHRRYEGLWRWRRLAWRSMALLLSRPRLAKAALAVAREAPAIPRAAVALAGGAQACPKPPVFGAARGAVSCGP